MELEILERLNRFQLGETEEGGFQLDSADVATSIEESSRSLIGKVFGDKRANFTGLKNMLGALWVGSGPVKVREMGVNLYQFVFTTHADMLKVLHGKAWSFDSQFLILKQWHEDIDFQKECFNRVQLWV